MERVLGWGQRVLGWERVWGVGVWKCVWGVGRCAWGVEVWKGCWVGVGKRGGGGCGKVWEEGWCHDLGPQLA